MKRLMQTCLAAVLPLLMTASSNAWWSQGKVFCDADQNKLVSVGDVGLQSVLVIVTNTSGTYSNYSWTAADGFYIVPLTNVPDSYVQYIYPTTLPSDAVPVIPPTGVWYFQTSTNVDIINADFLVSSSVCASNVPPRTNACWLTGGGEIRTGGKKGQPDHSFGGVVYPGCNPLAGNGGNWNHVAHALKLHFQGRVIDVVNCGNVPGIPPGSKSPKTPFNFIEFQGTGTLKGIGGNKANYGEVFFSARCEDRGEPGKGVDRYYLRVYDSTGTTLLLVSTDMNDALDVAPTAITSGNLQLHVSGCDKSLKKK